MSSGSIHAPWCWTRKQMHLHVLYDICQSNLWSSGVKGVFHISLLVVQQCATTLPFILLHTELFSVVTLWPCGGHVNGAREVSETEPIQQPAKCSFKTSHTKRMKCACAPSCESCVSKLRCQPGLQHCQIICYIQDSIKNVRSSQII
jgi:hypothetical protein